MNTGKHDEPALLGTFAKTGYISFGTKENPLPYSNKLQDRDNFKGKQFGGVPVPTGKMPSTFYEKTHPWVAKDLPYVDRIKYAEVQKTKPGKGFGTSDYMRRDEFSNSIRTGQYREQLKSEGKFAKRSLASTAPQPTAAASSTLSASHTRPREAAFLYDLVFEAAPTAAEDQAASRKLHDTKNPTLLGPERYLGPYQTTFSAFHGTVRQLGSTPTGHMGITA